MSLQSLTNVTSSHRKPLICLEVNPPRGVVLDGIFKRLQDNVSGIDFFNVTDCALARMKLAALPFASLLKERLGIEPLVNVSCRDRNLIAIQADLLAAWATGIRSIVALTGDAVTIGDSPERKGVFEVNSIGLLQVIEALNSSKDISGNDLKGAPSFIAGVVVNPNARNPSAELKRLKRKKDAGALYALSQPVFDEELSAKFFSEAKEIGVPILAGLMPLKNGKSARALDTIPGIKISDKLRALVNESPDGDLSKFSIDLCLQIARANVSHVSGFHVVAGSSPGLALELAQSLVNFVDELR